MKKDVIDIRGNKIEEINLNDKVFGIEPNQEAIRQYIRVYRANQRQGTSSAKTRAEVSGSGKKPWRQKGTGRARVGDKRNPLWTKGGVAHGPKPKSWSLSLPKKIRQLVMKSVLSVKFNDNALIIDKVDFKEPKTKSMLKVLDVLKVRGRTLLVMDEVNDTVIKSSSNIGNIKVAYIDNVNAYDFLNCKNVLITKEAVKKLEERYK